MEVSVMGGVRNSSGYSSIVWDWIWIGIGIRVRLMDSIQLKSNAVGTTSTNLALRIMKKN
jgi:hypothetical protein